MSTTSISPTRGWFEAAMEQSPDIRRQWLRHHCQDSRVLRSVLLLLDGEDRAGLLDYPLDDSMRTLTEAEDVIEPDSLIGSRIGPFRLIGLLGQGGMAAVFLGEREDADFRQRVAVKLLRRGLFSAIEQRLFRRERQALAALSHPNIARLIDGGVSEAGIAYLAMEYVDGEPMFSHAERAGLDLRARLRLIASVCRAAQAAHNALIVHRDIKPSNIMVNTEGELKLLDFGVAKLLDDDDAPSPGAPTVFTGLTPAYAAPEQFDGGPITTATDVYSLGVVMHELLLGVRPLDTGPHAALRGPQQRTLAGSPARARPQGELAVILGKALAAEPTQRYASAGELADDIDRYLRDQPIAARAPSLWYRSSKFVRRNRSLVAVASLSLLAIAGFTATAVWQARLAERQAQRANAARDFMIELLDANEAQLPANQRPTPDILVAKAVERLRANREIDPELRVELLGTLGRISYSIGDYTHADTLLAESIASGRKIGLDDRAPVLLNAMVLRAVVMQATGRTVESGKLLETLLPALRSWESTESIDGLAQYASNLLLAGEVDRSLAIADEATTKARRLFPSDSMDLLKAESMRGQILSVARRYKEGRDALEPIVRRWRALKIPRDREFAQMIKYLAEAKENSDDLAGSEALHLEGIELRRRIHGRPHDQTARALDSYGVFLMWADRFDESERVLQEALSVYRSVLGPEHRKVAGTLSSLGTLEYKRLHFDAAERYLREALRIILKDYRNHQEIQILAAVQLRLGMVLTDRGKIDEAEPLIAGAIENFGRYTGTNNETMGGLLHRRVEIHLARKRPDLALLDLNRASTMFAGPDSGHLGYQVENGLLRSQALAMSGRSADALVSIDTALGLAERDPTMTTQRKMPLFAQKARVQRLVGLRDGFAATVATARSLKPDPALLSAGDAIVLGYARGSGAHAP
ncbi:protein kinase domain-containing protein [Lysobacter sp. CA199]|uniref:protein kinase domain-containing protein n=1 Tax=Lysobacter sp. CA199 TaxID=3455608 RepID=UPI003F8D6F8D